MGICVYWSCRHVVFVKRCNCLFNLTVGPEIMAGTEGRVVCIAVDGSEHSEKAFDCK